MVNKIVVVDFSGTLIKPFVAEEANLLESDIFGIMTAKQAKNKRMHATKKIYELIKNNISKKIGIEDDMKISFVQNFDGEINISGRHIKTMIMTDLFRVCMYMTAKKHRTRIFSEGILEALSDIKKNGYKIAIVSGIRTDIITGMLQIAKCPLKFDYIYGQDPVLSRDDNQLLEKMLAKKGKIEFIIGDKLSDLKPAKAVGAKSIFLKGGHPSGGEEQFADYVIEHPKELLNIIK